jgi:hypothetical protein
VISQPDSPHAQAYRLMADRVWAKVTEIIDGAARKMPRIVVS